MNNYERNHRVHYVLLARCICSCYDNGGGLTINMVAAKSGVGSVSLVLEMFLSWGRSCIKKVVSTTIPYVDYSTVGISDDAFLLLRFEGRCGRFRASHLCQDTGKLRVWFKIQSWSRFWAWNAAPWKILNNKVVEFGIFRRGFNRFDACKCNWR